jgi:DNA-directed RNA polymerase subunit RPC12/RpoP
MPEDSNCSRCGKSYQSEQMTPTRGGNLFCPDCWARVNPKNEVLRKCPADGENMKKKLVAEVVVIDVCSKCGGLWFDRGELEVIEKKSREMGWNEGFFTSILLL